VKAPVLLIQPPHAKACEPPPGLLVLAAHLRALGIATTVRDVNLEVQEALLSPSALERACETSDAEGLRGAARTSARRAARRAPAALAALRRPETYLGWAPYRGALDALGEGWASLSRARGMRLTGSDLELPGLSPLSSADLVAAAEDPALVPLAAELGLAADALLGQDPALVGVSVTYLSQALPAFALAGLLRRRGYQGTLVLGGGLVTSWARRLQPASPVFRAWDALVMGPGEEAVASLARGEPLTGAPGLLAPALGVWNSEPGGRGAPVCFRPDPEGLPWDRYLAPGPILPLAASRGCYWRRCAFCPEAAQDRQPFRPARADDLADAILRARDAVGVTRVHLTDDAVPLSLLRRLARRLRGEAVRWYGFVRLEPALRDAALARELAEGGCAMLQLGVETASQRLLDRMAKGTRATDAASILRNLSEVGIRTYAYLLFGLPGETADEARQTATWAAAHAPWITFVNLARFHLPRGSALDSEGEGERAGEGPGPDLSLYRPPRAGEEPVGRPGYRVLADARRNPALRSILVRTPPGFGANHAAFSPLPERQSRDSSEGEPSG